MNENRLKSYFAFTKSERIAIITIVSMIVIILVIKYLIVTNPPKRDYFKHNLDSIVARREFVMDSVRVADSINRVTYRHNEVPRSARNDNPLSFRPKRNEMERSGGTSNKYRSTSNEIPRSARNDSGNHTSFRAERSGVEKSQTIDINVADTTLLKQLPGIGSSFAKRIVDYRDKLGGYCESEQLLEVYKMDTARYEGIKDYVKIDSLFTPNKLKINSDAFKVLLKHPYLEYNDVKKIVNHREQKGMIISWEQLKQVVGDGVNPKLRYYVDYQ